MTSISESSPAHSSPLTEAQPFSINELFSREPEELSDSEIDFMVKELRKQREVWAVAEKNKASKAKAPSASIDPEALNILLREI